MKNYANGRTLPFIVRVIEENVDGCGGDAVMYVGVNKPIRDALVEQFEKVLRDTKAEFGGEDYDTESFVEEAVERFNNALASERQEIRAIVVDAPFDAVVTF